MQNIKWKVALISKAPRELIRQNSVCSRKFFCFSRRKWFAYLKETEFARRWICQEKSFLDSYKGWIWRDPKRKEFSQGEPEQTSMADWSIKKHVWQSKDIRCNLTICSCDHLGVIFQMACSLMFLMLICSNSAQTSHFSEIWGVYEL